MIITKPELIKLNEKSFIESLIENLDWKLLEKVVEDRLNLSDIKCKEGDIIVHKGEVAYKLNLELKLDLDVIIDREGEFVNYKEPDINALEEISDEALLSDEIIEDLDEELLIEDDTLEDSILDTGDLVETDNKDMDLDDILEKNREFWNNKSS